MHIEPSEKRKRDLNLLILDESDWGLEGQFRGTVSICHELNQRRRIGSGGATNHFSVPYHWEDEKKRSSDYKILSESYEFVLERLSSALGEVHGVTTDRLYWETALGAWLGTAMSIMSDRLGILESLIKSSPTTVAFLQEDLEARSPARDTLEFVRLASSSDSWNRHYMGHLAQEFFGDEILLLERTIDLTISEGGRVRSTFSLADLFLRLVPVTQMIFDGLADIVMKLFSRWSSRNLIAFDAPYFSSLTLVKLKWRLRHTARMVRVRKASSLIFSTKSSVREDFRKALFQQPKTDNDFADRFIREAPSILPASFLESFASIRSSLVEINSIPNIVYTANSHWYDDQFKIWAAEMRIFGARMVFSEHGGSFEGAELLFDFEQRISDHYISGWPPRRPNETQLPLRLVSSKTKKRGSYEKGNLLLVTYPGVKWSIRASSQPQSYRAMSIADDLERLVDRLKAIPASKITVQLAQSDLSWGLLESHYSSGSLSDCETAKSPLSVMLRKARLVVCTYPQTTFMDSLMAGVPTILLFTQDVSGLSDNSQEVLTKLSEQGVVFYSAEQAANFIDSIWGNPMEWWKASDTRRAIDEFLRFTMLDKEKPLDCLSGFLQQAVLQKKSS